MIAADLGAVSDAGFDLVRVFLFWRDVEPELGRYDEAVLDRLVWFVEEARTHGLKVLCSVLTVWMNGQLFEPDWFEGVRYGATSRSGGGRRLCWRR